MCIKKLFKNLSIAIALSIITTSSSVIPVFATNMCVSIDSNGNEIVYDDVLFHDIDSTHGQSGAPILVQTITGNYTAIAIHNGGKKENESNRAVRTSDTVKDLILKAHHD